MPQPQQLGMQALSVTYTTANGNTRSLTHWTRPRIEPTSSEILGGFLTHWASMGTPKIYPLKIYPAFSRKAINLKEIYLEIYRKVTKIRKVVPSFFFFFSFILFRAASVTPGSSQASGWIQLPAYTTTTAMPDSSCICKLHGSFQQSDIFDSQSEARDRTDIFMGTSLIPNTLSHNRNSIF